MQQEGWSAWREKDDEEDQEHEANLEEALADKTKVVKWFVDRGFGFGKVSTGEIVVIHASAVVGAETLTIGTDAWVQVVNDDARAQGGYRARRAWGQDVWKAEKDKERANKVAQQVRRAAALTAELAAQSIKKTAAVCDQPRGLDELAWHMEAPNMEAGGSHPQATMMPDPWATSSRLSARESQVETSALFKTDNRVPARVPRCSSSISHPSFVNTSARSELDERGSAAKKRYGAGTASPSQEGRNMGTLPKATDLDAEDKRGVRK